GIRRAADRGRVFAERHVVAAAGRRGRLGMAGRPHRPQDAADDLDPVVFDLHLHRRLLAGVLVSLSVPRAAGHRHGRRVAGLLGHTLTACWWMASSFLVYYSINALFATHLQKDLNLSPALVATPVALANLAAFIAQGFWGWFADRFGRRWSMIIPAAIAIFVA